MGIAYLVGALALALVHVLSGNLNLSGIAHRRRWLSLAAGVSVAYVFLDLLPLMGDKQRAFVEAMEGKGLPFPQFRVYVAALLGFTIFYGLEQLMGHRKSPGTVPAEAEGEDAAGQMVPVHEGGFAIYNLMMGYLLVEWSKGLAALALYCGALALHILITDEGMRSDYGVRFERFGRWLMAGSILAGALVAWLAPVSISCLTTIVGLVAGGVVINSIKDEFPREGEGRFTYFALGALSYGALILWAAWLEAGPG
ncbi:hypothetical protein LLH03_11225 [bacterium]|nr:hypothetical protein [bacterium]